VIRLSRQEQTRQVIVETERLRAKLVELSEQLDTFVAAVRAEIDRQTDERKGCHERGG
jgi:hypothetical protein